MSQALVTRPGLSDRTVLAGRDVMEGRRRGPRDFLPFAGPAVIASIAYMDPGNFATNIQAGSSFGYTLLWVVLMANLVAMLFQSMSARVGIVTGKSLAQLCRDHFPKPLVGVMWVVSEIAAMATDLAELLGAGIGISLLFGLPLLPSVLVAFVITFILLSMQSRGFRPIELVIAGFVGVIGLAYLIEIIIAPPNWAAAGYHTFVPHLAGPESITLAVGIIGATVMPHAIYLHSALMVNRMPTHNDAERRVVIGYSNREVLVALSLAGMVNMAMVAMAATVFHQGHSDVGEIETAYHTLTPLLGAGAATVFMISLLASGVASSVVGTMAGQTIMQDFVGFRIPMWVRRTITMLPAVVVVAIGMDTTRALVLSQVVLSLALPVPMIALLVLSGRRDIMGVFTNSALVRAVAIVGATIVLSLNVILLLQAAGVPLNLPFGE